VQNEWRNLGPVAQPAFYNPHGATLLNTARCADGGNDICSVTAASEVGLPLDKTNFEPETEPNF
jgi:hypothetical protein